MPHQPTHTAHGTSTRRDPRPLIVQAGIARTFGSLGSGPALFFLGAGVYLLQEVFSNPLRDQSAGLITGAFVIALAVILIYYIFIIRRGDAQK